MKHFLLPFSYIFIPTLLFHALGLPFARELGVLVTAALLWLTEALPPGVTGLLIPVMLILTGSASVEAAFAPFAHQMIFFLLGSFMLVRALQANAVDHYIAARFSAYAQGASAEKISIGLALSTWILGSLMSNTACALLLLPIVLALIKSFEPALCSAQQRRRLECRLLMTVALVPSIGGMLTPLGSLPNAVALAFLTKTPGASLSFSEWLLRALPVSLSMLLVVLVVLRLRFPLSDLKLVASKQVQGTQPIILSSDGRRLLALVLLAVCLWTLPGMLPAEYSVLRARLPLGVSALVVAILLFLIPKKTKPGEEKRSLLEPADIQQLDYGTIALFAGGLCLGKMLLDSGLAHFLGQQLSQLAAPGSASFPLLVVMFTILFSEVGSNTASASLMIPIVLGTFSEAAPQAVPYTMGIALAAGLGSMLPVSTPPNALVYATGKVPLREMLRTGIWIDLAGLMLIWLWLLGSS